MATRERRIQLGYREDLGLTEGRVVEEVRIGKEDTAHRVDVEVEDKSMLVSAEAEADAEYKGYQALIDRAVDVFGDELIASRWLSMPSDDFNGDVPLRVAQHLGYKQSRIEKVFEPIFVRIEHGIYF